MPSKQRLHQYLLGLDQKHRVSRHDLKNQMLEQDVKSIVKKALAKVTEKDDRFKFKLHRSGSYYDGVKVGSPDEFDYVAAITTLQGSYVTFTPTDDPGFVQIKLNTVEERWLWRDCLSDIKELQNSVARSQIDHWSHEDESSQWKQFVPLAYLDDRGEIRDDMIPQLKQEYTEITQIIAELSSAEKAPADIDYKSENMILAPSKLQKQFKTLFDEAMSKIDLPMNWEHGGFQRPQYSGCRRHGPATMIMLVYHNQEEEIKINVDVTIGIPVPCPVDFKRDLNMNVFEKIKSGSTMEEILRKTMNDGPSIYLIPLYSKMLVKTRRYSNKYSFRISCSSIEKAILNTLHDEAGPKKCLRILKVIRDEYLTEGRRKTHRMKNKSKRRKCELVQNSAITSGQAREVTRPGFARPKKKSTYTYDSQLGRDIPESTENAELTVAEYASRVAKAELEWSQEMVRYEQILESDELINMKIKSANVIVTLESASDSDDTEMDVNDISQSYSSLEMETDETAKQKVYPCSAGAVENLDAESQYPVTLKPYGVPPVIRWPNDEENDTTDLTDVDQETTKEEAFKKFLSTKHQYQSEDIADMTCEPGSGEYYGPSTYMASIEIKTYILMLLAKTNWDSKDWSDEKVCDYVINFLQQYQTLLHENKMIKNFFFESLVCSPISEEKRLKALEKYNVLQKDINDIMEGKPKISA